MHKKNDLLIILDFGANDGCSVLKFKKKIKEKRINNYKIYCFEPNPFFKKKLEKITKDDKNVIYFDKIVGTKNIKTKLFLSQGGNDGSSIYSDKKTNKIDKNVYIICEQIDIVEYINQLPSHNKLWIKMDIEGSEYNIIPHMHKYNLLKKMNKLFIEWHYTKIPSITKAMHENTVNLVADIDTEVWDALPYRDRSTKYKQEYQKFLNNIRYDNL